MGYDLKQLKYIVIVEMPSIKVNCPICSEKVYESGLGKHFLSKTHAAHLLKENQKLKGFLQALKTNCYMTNGKNDPPLFSVTKTDSYHICLSCKKCYKNDDNNNGVKKHYEKSPKCKEDGIAKLEAFIYPVVKGDKDVLEKIAKLQMENRTFENASVNNRNKFEIADAKVDRLLSLISKMCGPDFDIYTDDHLNELETYLDENPANEGNYSMVKFTQG